MTRRGGFCGALGALLLAFVLLPFAARGEGPWHGNWVVTWNGGSAELRLEQQGDRVAGTRQPHGDRLEGIAEGRRMTGAWTRGDERTTLELVLAADGASFVGREADGDWWSGRRDAAAALPIPPGRATPREAMRRFLIAGHIARDLAPEAWAVAAETIAFEAEGRAPSREEELNRARLLYDLVDLTTFRLEDVPARADGDRIVVRLEQTRTLAALPLTMLRDGAGGWRIAMPPPEDLVRLRRRLLEGRGGALPAQDEFRRLRSARDAMRSFLLGMASLEDGGRDLVVQVLDLSATPEVIRAGQGELAAHYLRRTLQQIGFESLQAIPDDGRDRVAYVHFSHPAGRIVIAPRGPEADAPWVFTSETVQAAGALFRVTEALPPPPQVPPGAVPPATFFTLREQVRALAPGLLTRIRLMEAWQPILLLTMVGCAILVGLLASRLVCRALYWLGGQQAPQPRWFRICLAACVAVAVISPFPTLFGVPAQARHYTAPVVAFIIIVAGAATGWHLLRVCGDHLTAFVKRTVGTTDDIVVSLGLAILRTGLLIGAGLALAQLFSISTAGILAGLGIGGLAVAFASRETLSNVFGAAILVSDRPFGRGDWISTNDVSGSVEHVGIRSTRVRTAQGDIVVIPNGKLADSSITNTGSGPHRILRSRLTLAGGAAPERLEGFIAAARARIEADAAFRPGQSLVAMDAVNGQDVEVAVTAHLAAASAVAAATARQSLLLDLLRMAESQGLRLNAGAGA